MQIIVVGNGKVGKVIVSQLTREGHNVVVIDNNPDRIAEAQNDNDVMCVCGNGACRSVQLEARAQEADLLIAVTAVDEVNLLCCLIAKKLGTKKTVARVRNPDYVDEMGMIRDVLELDMVINPELAAARDIFSVLRLPGLLNVEKFGKGRVELAELRITDNSPLAGFSLNEINKKFKVRVLICAVRRGSETFIPNGDFVLRAGDSVSFAAGPDQAIQFLRDAGIPVKPPKNVIVVGGGRLAFYLAKMLRTIGVHPVIIERDHEKCREFAAALPDCPIINGDGADRALLQEEGIRNADAFVAVTGTDEVNILLSNYATSQNVPKVVTKVSRIDIIELLGDTSVGSIVSPKDLAASRIVSYVRAMHNSGEGNNVETLYRIVDGTVEALEFIVRDNDPALVGVSLRDLKLRDDLLICAIVRGSQVIIPSGSDSFAPGDHVIVVTKNRRLNDLRNILA
ncbi:MAG: Trk system potassium transporter TrkA [Oscillospiraceae bacterium]